MGCAVNLVVSCTSRKRYEVAPGLAVHEINAANLDARLRAWKDRLHQTASPEYPARRMYMGDHWSIASSIPFEAAEFGFRVQLWVCSAGYGLIDVDTPIKPYRATFTPGMEDYVASGLRTPIGATQAWWDGVCEHRLRHQQSIPRSLLALANLFPRTPIIVALSKDYLAAVESDLANLLDRRFFRDHLAIVSCGTDVRHPTWKHNLLPCDAAVVGTLGGALTSLNVRVVRSLFQTLNGKSVTVENLSRLAQSIKRSPRTIPIRKAVTDEDVARFIRSALNRRADFSKSRLLDDFRHRGKACEQKRFGEVYMKVRRELRLGAYA